MKPVQLADRAEEECSSYSRSWADPTLWGYGGELGQARSYGWTAAPSMILVLSFGLSEPALSLWALAGWRCFVGPALWTWDDLLWRSQQKRGM